MWHNPKALKESAENSRVGLRQGQKLGTIRSGDSTIELVSPVEGVVTAVNKDILEDSTLIARDPTRAAGSRSCSPRTGPQPEKPGARTDGRTLAAEFGHPAQWHGRAAGAHHGRRWRLAVAGLLARVSPERREKLVKEFFLA